MDVQRQAMDVDIACVGFGPATAAFLTTLTREIMNDDGSVKLESQKMPGMPLQIMCYERADDISFGVSGVVTKAKAIRETYPGLKPEDVPMAMDIKKRNWSTCSILSGQAGGLDFINFSMDWQK